MNCSISVLLAEPTQVPPQQQVGLDSQLSALHEAAAVEAAWHSRQACQQCSSHSCTCASGGNSCSSTSSSCSDLAVQVTSPDTVEEHIHGRAHSSDYTDCDCNTKAGCGISDKCFRSVSASSSSELICKESGACQPVYSGKLALISFNDAVAAYELAAEGVPMHGGSFGGSAREG